MSAESIALALCDKIEAEPDDERACRRCRVTMGAPPAELEPSTLCNLCAQAACVELAAAVRVLLAEVRVVLDDVNATLARRVATTTVTARQVEILDRKARQIDSGRPARRKKARR